ARDGLYRSIDLRVREWLELREEGADAGDGLGRPRLGCQLQQVWTPLAAGCRGLQLGEPQGQCARGRIGEISRVERQAGQPPLCRDDGESERKVLLARAR